MIDPTRVQHIAAALQVYIQHFGHPKSAEQLAGITGTLISVLEQTQEIKLSAQEVATTVESVVDNLSELPEAVADAALERWVATAHQWRMRLREQVQHTLLAYAQQYPALPAAELSDAIATLVPLVQERPTSRAEVRALALQLADQLNLDTALDRVIPAPYRQLAQRLAVALSQRSLEQTVRATVTGYVERFEPTLEVVGETLVERALETVLKSSVDFDWDPDLDMENRRLLIRQVVFRINILQADPPPTANAARLAEQLHRAVAQFHQQQAEVLTTTDFSAPASSDDDLSVRSRWRRVASDPSEPS